MQGDSNVYNPVSKCVGMQNFGQLKDDNGRKAFISLSGYSRSVLNSYVGKIVVIAHKDLSQIVGFGNVQEFKDNGKVQLYLPGDWADDEQYVYYVVQVDSGK